MMGLVVAIGVLLILGGSAVIMLGLINYFFPSTAVLVPEAWKTALSLKFGVYYLVAGLALAVLVP
ncbi:MAG: hypothetical protein R3F02_14125 [Thiolinea sp.]